MIDTIGIDISKAMLDAYWQSGKKHKQFCNTGSGLRALVRWIERSGAALVVFEATGVYHRLLETGLAEHGVPFSMVNPRQARRFAEGTGILAKTDRVDASMLARMGALLEMKADEPTRKIIRDIKDMETARQALIRDRTAAKARLGVATLPLLRRQASLRLRQIERNLAEVDAAIETTIRADTEFSRKADILTSIPGIAKVTAFAMLIHMPELGELTGKQVASLGGLAPISRQSGKWQGKERIQGGRARLRRAMYLPAVVATRFNPDMKAKYHALIGNGKCKKLAITAVMRKLLILANVLIRDDRKWTETRA